MLKTLFEWGAILGVGLVTLNSCDDQDFSDVKKDATRVEVNIISAEMAKVRDYVPPYAVMAHRGSTFWTPEETEAAWRWAREMGADYLESDLQCSKDGVILANHDDNLKRTTNIENVFSENLPSSRRNFYIRHGVSPQEADELVKADRQNFRPYYAMSYMYEELLQLDAGTWFNESNMEQARAGFTPEQGQRQYVSALEDQIRYAEGKILKRDAEGERVYTITGTWDSKNPRDCLKYSFKYENDPKDTGNRPGIYIEFKESWLNPSDFEKRVYNKLDELGWNIMTKAAADGNDWYKNNKVNVGNTNGKVILQTFSLESLRRAAEIFKGQIPMCFLFWEGTGATDLKVDTPEGYASFINIGLEYKAHIIGPSIAGAPNNYPELNAPWQAYLIKKSGMLNHPYSFDSYAQMGKYFGLYNWGNKVTYDETLHGIYGDGLFTNRSEISLQFLIDNGMRVSPAPQIVPGAIETLNRLGYQK